MTNDELARIAFNFWWRKHIKPDGAVFPWEEQDEGHKDEWRQLVKLIEAELSRSVQHED